jgi:hypothetical protein
MRRKRHAPSATSEEEIMRSSWLLMSCVILALIGCAQGMPPQGQAPYTPNLPGSDANMHEHGGGDGGGGGGSM